MGITSWWWIKRDRKSYHKEALKRKDTLAGKVGKVGKAGKVGKVGQLLY